MLAGHVRPGQACNTGPVPTRTGGQPMGRAPKSPNEQLRTLIDEARFSNKGLARRVVDLAAARGVNHLRHDHTSVLRWLAGEQPREPTPELIADILSERLGRRVGTAELGMADSDTATDIGLDLPMTWSEGVHSATALWRADLERRRFLVESALAVSASSVVALRWLVSPRVDPPTGSGRFQVGRADIDAIREITRSYRELDNRLGGGRLRDTVVQYLNSQVTPALRDGSFTEQIGKELATASAELAQLAGWMAYDSGLHGLAQRYLTQALNFARHAGDDGLGGEILAAHAHQAVYLARPEDAVDLARAAQVTARRAGLSTLLTESYVMEAHGHAARDDARSCARALSDAEAAFERSVRENDPAWLRYFDEAYLAARMAHCFRDLGESEHAEKYARRSLDMDGRFVRGKAFNLSLLATSLAQQGEIEEACRVGNNAVDLTARLQSVRSVRYVRDLQRTLTRHSKMAVVQAFNEQVAKSLPAASTRTERR